MTSRIAPSLAVPGLLAAAILAVAMAPGSAASQSPSTTTVVKPPAAPAATAAPADDAAGEALVRKACSSCHDVGMVTSQRKSADAWSDTVGRMIAHGAPISDEQAEKIVDYLAKAYPAS